MMNIPLKNSSIPDYFKLPFEVHYSSPVAVTMLDFKSNIEAKKFQDIKIVHEERGYSFVTSFVCCENKGPELYCCLSNLHDDVEPEWLTFLTEDSVHMNSGTDYSVKVKAKEIHFLEFSDAQQDEDSDKFIDVENMEDCCSSSFFAYHIGSSKPEYLILDSESTRIKINLNGFVIGANGDITNEQVILIDQLNGENYFDYTTLDLWEAKFDWVQSIIEKDFPKQVGKLKLANN